MEDVFYRYWWLLFPLAWFVLSGWKSWLRHQRRRDELDLMRTYAAHGKTPPQPSGD
jgi:hypothetical protein